MATLTRPKWYQYETQEAYDAAWEQYERYEDDREDRLRDERAEREYDEQ